MREIYSLGSGQSEDQDVCELKGHDKSKVATHMGIIKCFLHLKQAHVLSESESTKG